MRSVRPGVGVEPSGFTPDGGGGESIPRLTKWIEDIYCEVIKIVDGESPEECLKRELEEEFGIQVEVGEFITPTNRVAKSPLLAFGSTEREKCHFPFPHKSMTYLHSH